MRTQNSLRARRPQRVVEVKVRTRVLWSVPTCRTFFAYPTHGYLLPDTKGVLFRGRGATPWANIN